MPVRHTIFLLKMVFKLNLQPPSNKISEFQTYLQPTHCFTALHAASSRSFKAVRNVMYFYRLPHLRVVTQASHFPILQNSKQALGGGGVVNGHRELLLLGLKRPGHEADCTLSSGQLVLHKLTSAQSNTTIHNK